MISSDDEAEAVTESITNYYFVDGQGEPTSFSVLPIVWNESKSSTCMKPYAFLHGTTDGGSEAIYKKVVAWKLDFSYDQPEISVLSKGKKWIKLRRPRKSFEDTIRTVLITIHCLHFFKKHPGSSESSLWCHLQKVFSLCKVKPSENDLLDHLPLITAAVEQDKTIAKPVFRLTFLKGLMKRKMFDEDIYDDFTVKKSKLTTESDKEFDGETEPTNENESDQVWEMCEDVCALCDNGGDVICCEGRCLRSFHATVDTGFASGCKSLGLSREQVEAPHFFCLNCQYNQHQCFACGKLGFSDRSSNPEVFRCAFPACGHFYHPLCVAKLLHPINVHAADQVQRKIISGEPFTCTVHKCFSCKQEEDTHRDERQFAVCRRCPKVYHRECLPRGISFETSMDDGLTKRAWDDLLPDRILIYCLKHNVDMGTLLPEGNHIIFPDVQGNKETCNTNMQPSQGKFDTKRIHVNSRNSGKGDPVNQQKQNVQFSHTRKDHTATNFYAKPASQERFFSKKNTQAANASRLHLKNTVKNPVKVDKFSALNEAKTLSKEEALKKMASKGLDSSKSMRHVVPSKTFKETQKHVPLTKKSSSSSFSVRTEMKPRIVDRMEKKSPREKQRLIVETHKKEYPQVETHTTNMATPPGSVKDSVSVVSALTQKLGHSFDPTANYEPEVFLDNGASLRSFSSHNIIDKVAPQGNGEACVEDDGASVQNLEQRLDDPKANYAPGNIKHSAKLEIADMLISYAQNRDTIVTFCYHDNDFSCLVSQRLEETGKHCSVKNYGIFQLEGDFDFEEDLIPTGSRLIIGLLFPPGVGVAVNKLIDKVLKFIPKLLLLLCPKETKRLDENESRYELILEEGEHFLTKSLCGSSDPPRLMVHLWSRCDWTKAHKSICIKKGHVSNDVTNQTSNAPEGNGEVETLEVVEVASEELMDVSADFSYGNSLQFASGPALPYLYGSGGWLDE